MRAISGKGIGLKCPKESSVTSNTIVGASQTEFPSRLDRDLGASRAFAQWDGKGAGRRVGATRLCQVIYAPSR
ncbi:unnamed protein product [Gemmata massiliana]|uniref:Uncharacterized protein n=1 Tax=Gemmata massiliana TaxID=1210884 RepID=A0A6P2CYS3_9BACT|nr:unnamed protein product [Gemmata massiliana]